MIAKPSAKMIFKLRFSVMTKLNHCTPSPYLENLDLVAGATFDEEKQEGAWEIDSENTYVQHDKPTLI